MAYPIRDVVEVAQRLQKIRHPTRDVVPTARKVAGEAGPEMIWLNIGDPNAYDFDTPGYVKKALVRALENRMGGYADSSGYKPLREAVAESNRRKGFDSPAEKILVTSGTSEATNMLYGAMLNPGDGVLVPSPCYPQYENMAYYYDAVPKFYELREEEGFQPDFDSLRKLVEKNNGMGSDSNGKNKAKLLVAINPNNPTGAVMEEKSVKKMVEFAGEHGLVLLSDEIYDEMVYEKKAVAAASLSQDVPTVTLNGLSKNFLAPGWRVGWASFSNFDDDGLQNAVAQLCRLRLSAPLPAQYAAAEALNNTAEYEGEREKMVEKLRARRDLAFKRLNELPGVSCAKPEGAFYAFPQLHDAKAVWEDDKKFVYELLEQQRVVTVFGSGFAQKPGTKHFRIVFLPPESVMEEAFARMEKFLRGKGF